MQTFYNLIIITNKSQIFKFSNYQYHINILLALTQAGDKTVMGSDTADWLKKVPVSKGKGVKVSFEIEEDEVEEDIFTKPKANAIRSNYSSKDLTGMKVAHDFGSFQAGETDILVLEDVSVFEKDNSSALISMNLKEDARLKRSREVSRHAGGYSGYKEYEEETVDDSVITLGKARPSKILQKYDFASTEFNDEPGIEGFKLGSDQRMVVDEPKFKGLSDLDAVQSSGIEEINFTKKNKNRLNMDGEKRRAKKLAKTFFADEPEMVVEPEFAGNVGTVEIEEDDLDMQRIISATRREHLKTAVEVDNSELIEEAVQDRFVGGKSFDALIMSESIFNRENDEIAAESESNSMVVGDEDSDSALDNVSDEIDAEETLSVQSHWCEMVWHPHLPF